MRQALRLRACSQYLLLSVFVIAGASAGARAQPADAQEESCRTFVQKFYDGYWNQYLPRMKDPNFTLPGTEAVLRARPPVLSQELIDLILKDEKRSKETGDVGNLDFDPFLNSQDPDGKYLVTKVNIANATCMATISLAHTIAELKRSGSSWIFVNFHYSYFTPAGKKDAPDADLLQILKQ
jgi:hypothetical protein